MSFQYASRDALIKLGVIQPKTPAAPNPFLAEVGAKAPPGWKWKRPRGVPAEWTVPLHDLIITPIVVEPIVEDNWLNKISCAFDNLPPGVYGLVWFVNVLNAHPTVLYK